MSVKFYNNSLRRGVKPKEINISDEEKQKLLRISEISIQLDTYDDIFSDFDPRPYHQRAISDDLLIEIKKACKVKSTGEIEIKFLIPPHKKNYEEELLIKRRLKEYFKKHHLNTLEEISFTRRKGGKFVFMGAIFSLIATYILTSDIKELASPIGKFFFNLSIVLLEPAGWFTIWTGLDRILSTREIKKEELEFYSKMSKADFHFGTY